MELNADRLVAIAVIFAIIGMIFLIAGPYLPILEIIPLIIGSICFIVVIVTAILALCTYQRGYAKSYGREVF